MALNDQGGDVEVRARFSKAKMLQLERHAQLSRDSQVLWKHLSTCYSTF